MKSVRKILTVLLAVTMLLSMVPTGMAASPSAYTGGDYFNFNSAWTAAVSTDGFTITPINTTTQTFTNIAFTGKSASEWGEVYSTVSGAFSNFDRIGFHVKGTAGKQMMIRLYAGSTKIGGDLWLDYFNGNNQFIIYNMSGLNTTERNSITKVVVCPRGGFGGTAGSLQIFDAMFFKSSYSDVVLSQYPPIDANVTYNLKCYENPGTFTLTSANSVNMTPAIVNFTAGKDPYASVQAGIVGMTSGVDQFSLRVKGTAGQTFMVKFENSPSDPCPEQTFTLSGEEEFFTVDMTTGLNAMYTVQRKNLLRKVFIFPMPGNTSTPGQLTIYDARFYNTAHENVIDGEAQQVNLNDKWADGGDKVYTIGKSGASTTVNYTKPGGGGHWSAMSTGLFGKLTGNLARYQKIVFNVTGTNSKQIMIKLEGGPVIEQYHTFNGSQQTVTVDLSGKTSLQRSMYNRILIFAEPNVAGVSGSFTINNCTLVDATVNEYDGNAKEFSFNNLWNRSENSLTVTSSAGNNIAYAAGKAADAYVSSPVTGRLSDFNRIGLRFTATTGHPVRVVLGSYTYDITNIKIGSQVVVLDISNIPGAARDALTEVKVMPNYGAATVGNLLLSEAYFFKSADKAGYPGLSTTITDFDVNGFWKDSGDNVYTAAPYNGGTQISYTNKAAGWQSAENQVFGNFKDFDYLVLKVQGGVGKKFIFELQRQDKISTVKHESVFTGSVQTVVIPTIQLLDANLAYKIFMFTQWDVLDTGSIYIHEAYFTNENPLAEPIINEYDGSTKEFSFNAVWTPESAFTHTKNDGVNSFTFTSKPDFAKIDCPVSGPIADFDRIALKVKGTFGQSMLLKITAPVQGYPNEEVEFWYDNLTGTEQYLIADLSMFSEGVLDDLTNIMIFPAPENSPTGRLDIYEAYFFNSENKSSYANDKNSTGGLYLDANGTWVDSGEDTHTITSVQNGTSIAYDKPAGQPTATWAFTEFVGNMSDFKYLFLKLTGPMGTNAKLQFIGGDDTVLLEDTIAFTGSEQTATVDLRGISASVRNNMKAVNIIPEFDNTITAAEGTVIISEFLFSKTTLDGNNVIAAINALPATALITPEHEDSIEACRSAYAMLSPEEQASVSNLSVLVAAEAELEKFSTYSLSIINPDLQMIANRVFFDPDENHFAPSVNDMRDSFQTMSAGCMISFVDTAGIGLDEYSLLGTGTKVTLKYKDYPIETITFILYGDIDGDGVVNSADLVAGKAGILGIEGREFSVDASSAANTNLDMNVNVADLIILKRYLVDLIPHPKEIDENSILPEPPSGSAFGTLNVNKEGYASFLYLWNQAQTADGPAYGLVRDRYPDAAGVASSAATGFALSALPIAVSYNWISDANARERASKTLDTLLTLPNINGFFYHFISMETGARTWNSEISGIDTAILMMGVLTAGQYFGGDIQTKANALYARVNWNFYRNPSRDMYYMSYNPDTSKFSGAWDVYGEQLMMYVLGAGAPNASYRIPKSMFYKFSRPTGNLTSTESDAINTNNFIYSWNGSIFTYQFSHAWIDFSGKTDDNGINWYNNSLNACGAAYNYALEEGGGSRPTLSPVAWGLTACDGPNGYLGNHGSRPAGTLLLKNDDIIAPYGAVASMPFTPTQSLAALNNYYGVTGLTGEYGLKDAFGTTSGGSSWIASNYVGIDKGITLLMLANYVNPSNSIWTITNQNEYIQNGLAFLGID